MPKRAATLTPPHAPFDPPWLCEHVRWQGSVDEAAAFRKHETHKAERLSSETADVKKSINESGGKRDVSWRYTYFHRFTPKRVACMRSPLLTPCLLCAFVVGQFIRSIWYVDPVWFYLPTFSIPALRPAVFF